MTGRIIRLVCLVLMSLWITAKMIAFIPLFAIPFVGVTIWFTISEISEMKEMRKNAKNKNKKRPSGNKKVTKKSN